MTNAKGMKPSERIMEIMNENYANGLRHSELVEAQVTAILDYLDSQHEAKGEV